MERVDRHTGEKPFQCRFCPKRAARKCQITVHEYSHTNERPYHCPHCPQRFNASGSLRWHMRVHFEGDEGEGYVVVCSAGYVHVSPL